MDRLSYWIYRLVATLLAPATIQQVFRAGESLGTLAFHLLPGYRRLVLRNLKIAFASEQSPRELEALARRHFAQLGANLLCSLKLPQMSPAEVLACAEVNGLENIQAAGASGHGVVLVLSHLGNWELSAQLAPLLFGCKVGTIYQRLGNPFLDAQVRRNRAQLGAELFERKEGVVRASQFIRRGGLVAVLIDQHAGDAGLWCPFFGRLASTSTLAATLALRTDARLMSAAVYTAGCGRWRLVISPPVPLQGNDADALTATLNQCLEELIRRNPADWFWVHNRWKTPRPKFLLAAYKRGILVPPKAPALKPFRILIRASNWLGDAVMSAPAVLAIKHGRPDAEITILTPAKLADFWNAVAEVDHVITFSPRENVFAVACKLGRGFDAAILFPNSLRVALEAWLAGIPRRVGRPGHRRRALLNQVFEPKKQKLTNPLQHQTHDSLELAKFIGADLHESHTSGGGSQPSTLNPRPLLALCPGAEYGPAKRWLPERFAEVMRTISARHGCSWKIFGVEKDRAIAEQISRAAGVPCIDRVGKTTLAELLHELRGCDALLTNDTGTMHLAAFLGVPTIALFGSTEPTLTGPLGARHRVIRHHVECSPCFLRECPIDFRCMKAIKANEVVAAVEGVLANSGNGKRRTPNAERPTSK